MHEISAMQVQTYPQAGVLEIAAVLGGVGMLENVGQQDGLASTWDSGYNPYHVILC